MATHYKELERNILRIISNRDGEDNMQEAQKLSNEEVEIASYCKLGIKECNLTSGQLSEQDKSYLRENVKTLEKKMETYSTRYHDDVGNDSADASKDHDEPLWTTYEVLYNAMHSWIDSEFNEKYNPWRSEEVSLEDIYKHLGLRTAYIVAMRY